MFNKITFNSADTSTWPQFIINGGYNSSVDKPNLTTHAKYGAGLTWVGVDGRDISIYGGYTLPIYQNDLGEVVTGSFVTAEDKTKFWAEDQMSNFTFVNSKGNTSTVTLNWGEALADGGSLPAEENNEEEENNDEDPKPIEGGGDNPAELEDGEEPKEGPIGEPIFTGPIGGEPTLNPIKGEEGDSYVEPTVSQIRLKEIHSILMNAGFSNSQNEVDGPTTWEFNGKGDKPEFVVANLSVGSVMVTPSVLMDEFTTLLDEVVSKEEPKKEFETPTDVEGLANFLQSFNAEIIRYNEALNQIESVLIETKEGLKKTENLDEEFTTRASHVTTKVAAINVKQAEDIAAVELELDAEVTQANELRSAMEVKVTEVESRNSIIQENPVISKLTQNVSGSLRTRHNTLMTSMSKVNELMARDVVVEKASEIENAKVEKEVIIKEQPIKGRVEFDYGMSPTMGTPNTIEAITAIGTIKAQP